MSAGTVAGGGIQADIAAEMDEISSAAAAKTYVATMDEDTCPSCASRHGLLLQAGEQTHVIPNPYCTCRYGCRCKWEWAR